MDTARNQAFNALIKSLPTKLIVVGHTATGERLVQAVHTIGAQS